MEKKFLYFTEEKRIASVSESLSTEFSPQESNHTVSGRKIVLNLWIAVQNIWNPEKLSQVLCTVIHRHYAERKTGAKWQKTYRSGTMDSLRK